jgi:hypothetical protein
MDRFGHYFAVAVVVTRYTKANVEENSEAESVIVRLHFAIIICIISFLALMLCLTACNRVRLVACSCLEDVEEKVDDFAIHLEPAVTRF